MWVPSLVRELRSHVLPGMAKNWKKDNDASPLKVIGIVLEAKGYEASHSDAWLNNSRCSAPRALLPGEGCSKGPMEGITDSGSWHLLLLPPLWLLRFGPLITLQVWTESEGREVWRTEPGDRAGRACQASLGGRDREKGEEGRNG